MQTKLSIYCDKFIEAGIWMAMVTTPLFFDPFSWGTFEEEKAIWLRFIILTMGLAWVIKTLEQGWRVKERGGRRPLSVLACRLGTSPLVWPVLLFAGAYILATFTSIAPRLSFWGSYARQEGTYTFLCYILLFFLARDTLRRPEQVHRLVTLILLTSFPVSLYALIQRAGLDPVPWTGLGKHITARTISTLGNAIFLGAYLIAVIPLTLARIVDILARRGEGSLIPRMVLVGCYTLLGILQILALLFTQSRGPLIGFLGSMFFLSLIWAVIRSKTLGLLIVGSAIPLLLFVILLNLPHTPLEPLRTMLHFGRLSPVIDLTSRGEAAQSIQQRMLIWEGTAHLIAAEPLRSLVGYGPETFAALFPSHFPPELAPYLAAVGKKGVDRSHSEILDLLATTGFTGLIGYLVLLGAIFYHGLGWLHLIKTRQQRALFVSLWALGAGLGLLIPWLLAGSLQFAGMGICLGLTLALVIFLILRLLGETLDIDLPTWHVGLLIALLSALLAHFWELQFGIGSAVTRIHFWLYPAMAFGLCRRVPPELPDHQPIAAGPTPVSRRRSRRHRDRRQSRPGASLGGELIVSRGMSLAVYAALMALILTTLAYALLNQLIDLRAHNYLILWFLATVWVFLAIVALAEVDLQSTSRKPMLKLSHLWPLLLPPVWLALFLAFYMPMTRPDRAAGSIPLVYSGWLLIAMMGLTLVLEIGELPPMRTRKAVRWWLYIPLGLIVLVFIAVTNLNPVMAYCYRKEGASFLANGDWEGGLTRLKRAVELSPSYDGNYVALAKAWLDRWEAASWRESTWLEEAERALEQAGKINPPGASELIHLGMIHLGLAETATNSVEREAHLRKSMAYYQQAVSRTPWPADVYQQWGRAYHVLEKYDEAIGKYEEALRFEGDSLQTYIYLGDAYGSKGDLDRSIEVYEQALALDPDAADVHLWLSYTYYKKDLLGEALSEGLKALELDPDSYDVHKNLGFVYEELDRMDKAIIETRKARDLAPAMMKGSLNVKLTDLIEKYLAPGQVYLDNGELGKAEEFYARILSRDPDFAHAHSALAYVYAQQGRLEEAVEENRKVLEIVPHDYESHKNLALLYQQLGRTKEALAEARLALSLAFEDQKMAIQSLISQLESGG